MDGEVAGFPSPSPFSFSLRETPCGHPLITGEAALDPNGPAKKGAGSQHNAGILRPSYETVYSFFSFPPPPFFFPPPTQSLLSSGRLRPCEVENGEGRIRLQPPSTTAGAAADVILFPSLFLFPSSPFLRHLPLPCLVGNRGKWLGTAKK